MGKFTKTSYPFICFSKNVSFRLYHTYSIFYSPMYNICLHIIVWHKKLSKVSLSGVERDIIECTHQQDLIDVKTTAWKKWELSRNFWCLFCVWKVSASTSCPCCSYHKVLMAPANILSNCHKTIYLGNLMGMG